MKKNVLALSIATAVVGFAGSAHAIGTIGTNATATQLTFGDTGIGHMLLVPYFSTQNGNATLLSLVNTDTVNGKAVKVRFRGAKNSDDIFDFQVFLSPGDVWTANVSQNADGRSALTTEDNSCTRPKSVNAPFVTSRNFEMFRNDLGYMRQNAKIVGRNGGFTYADLGATHHSLEDYAIMRMIPGLVVFARTRRSRKSQDAG